MNKIDRLIAPATVDFVQQCRQYIDNINSLSHKDISIFWGYQLKTLSSIYHGVFTLPVVETRYEADVEKFVSEREYNKILQQLVQYIGALDSFPDFSNLSHPGAIQVVEVSLAELLTDIYQELKDFVMLYETETLENMNDAIAECNDTFREYWGTKLLSALRIIHVNLYQHRYAEQKKSSQLLDEEIEEEMADNAEYEDTDE